jgi:hypothetical protein
VLLKMPPSVKLEPKPRRFSGTVDCCGADADVSVLVEVEVLVLPVPAAAVETVVLWRVPGAVALTEPR